ncbi:MAG TPA: hypothetical protein PLM29_07730 [Deltaproteobacteria bacterium]|nr:hypothetical protein [Deltaproteobacteria bacterium]
MPGWLESIISTTIELIHQGLNEMELEITEGHIESPFLSRRKGINRCAEVKQLISF